jgi:hypothetical protein
VPESVQKLHENLINKVVRRRRETESQSNLQNLEPIRRPSPKITLQLALLTPKFKETFSTKQNLRKDPNIILPVSTDLEYLELYNKLKTKLDSEFKWETVAKIPLGSTDESNFLPALHSVDGPGIDLLCAKSPKSTPVMHLGVDSEHKTP